MHFADAATLAEIYSALDGFVTVVDSALGSDVSVAIDPEVLTLNTVTGALESGESGTPPLAVAGLGGTTIVPNAVQGLIRWRTTAVVGGRFLRGRTYIPGMSQTTVFASGVMNTNGSGPLNAGAAALIATGLFGVWHRPEGGAGGVFAPATSSGVWREFAVQRRRRS